jgi:hypothetical protein
VQSLIVPAVEYQPGAPLPPQHLALDRADPLRPPDRAAARLGLGGVEPLDLGSSDVRSATTMSPGMLRT